MTGETITSPQLEDAVREIAHLRLAAAYEHQVSAAHAEFAAFPKSRRGALHEQLGRLRLAATGQADEANTRVSSAALASAMAHAGARPTLTIAAWAAEPRTRGDSQPATAEPVTVTLLAAAVDEIWALRQQLAYEAVVASSYGALRIFPKSRRGQLTRQVERLTQCARGQVQNAYVGVTPHAFDAVVREFGIREHLTVAAWTAARAGK